MGKKITSLKPLTIIAKPKEVLFLSEKQFLSVFKQEGKAFQLLAIPTTIETQAVEQLLKCLQRVLKEFKDVSPKDLPPGLPPIRGIEHQIDLVPGGLIT